ncbi:SOS response-associated peptidase [Cohnella sp. CFH 77786]|uniref:SOS response-associated peptidase n=1 Tax=Cohnella sp. CFH 77786 TaxID=2662265 RepID=UPI001C6095F7|nr:SOS response-associated peptidase [Cohnella sp. CFH 77786]MBW5444649.1 SOS response-associated peptidase [Cohnella sp. CFH 77786]
MCGRYTITITLEELMLRYFAELPAAEFHLPRYNVAPTQMVPAVVNDGRRNRLGLLKWGLIPPWAEDEKAGSRLINARAETLEERPAYRDAYRRKRCLVPADGFYEWKSEPGKGGKRPYRIVLRGGGMFSMAALYETWTAPDGRKVGSFAIVTTEPNALMAGIHDRMPVILRPEDEALWLDRQVQDPSLLRHLLVPYPADEMEAYEVDKRVGSPANDDAGCLERVGS